MTGLTVAAGWTQLYPGRCRYCFCSQSSPPSPVPRHSLFLEYSQPSSSSTLPNAALRRRATTICLRVRDQLDHDQLATAHSVAIRNKQRHSIQGIIIASGNRCSPRTISICHGYRGTTTKDHSLRLLQAKCQWLGRDLCRPH